MVGKILNENKDSSYTAAGVSVPRVLELTGSAALRLQKQRRRFL